MAYTKQTWIARQGTGLNKFETQNGEILTLTNQPDSITVEGTPFTADRMNHMEEGIKSAHEVIDNLGAVSTEDVVPLSKGGTYNSTLIQAPEGAIIMKRGEKGNNSSYLGYETKLPVTSGGTNATTPSEARRNLNAASLGYNEFNGSQKILDTNSEGIGYSVDRTYDGVDYRAACLLYGVSGAPTRIIHAIKNSNGNYEADNHMHLYSDKTAFGQPITIGSGGTGANNVIDAMNNLATREINTVPSEDTPAAWAALGLFKAYYNSTSTIINKPATYGTLLNIPAFGTAVTQIWFYQSGGTMYVRNGNSTGWDGKEEVTGKDAWKKHFTDANIIPAENGGTGLNMTAIPAYSIIRANSDPSSTSNLYYTPTGNGAFYATSENGAPKFGTLPLAQGGTNNPNLGSGNANGNFIYKDVNDKGEACLKGMNPTSARTSMNAASLGANTFTGNQIIAPTTNAAAYLSIKGPEGQSGVFNLYSGSYRTQLYLSSEQITNLYDVSGSTSILKYNGTTKKITNLAGLNVTDLQQVSTMFSYNDSTKTLAITWQ